MQKHEYRKARRFGRQNLHVKIITPVFHGKYSASRL
jgi:hypothetical protein